MLDVYVGSSKVGMYSRAPSGATSFRYDPDWLSSEKAFPISLSMPLSDRVWSGEGASSYFDGLLPDDRTVREKIAAREQADSASIFDLLAVIGRDCVGALRFVPEGLDPGDPTKMEYRPVTDDEIAARIASLGTTPLGIHIDDDDFRISIAGVQEKTAFLRINDQWQLPLGPTPTSHIFKPAMKEGPAGAGVLYRLPQEDICQALGVPPARKYQSDGGPGIVDVLELLNGAIVPYEDRMDFMKAQIVFWLLAAIDGHAKNFSIFLSPSGYRLTPLYDVMSAAPWPEFPDQKIKSAMALGNKNYYRLKQIQLRHFYQSGQKAGLREQDIDSIFSGLTTRMDDAIAGTAALAADAGMPESTSEPILAAVSKRAQMFQKA
jgi:serine/threonine-protein kinase HipA